MNRIQALRRYEHVHRPKGIKRKYNSPYEQTLTKHTTVTSILLKVNAGSRLN